MSDPPIQDREIFYRLSVFVRLDSMEKRRNKKELIERLIEKASS